MTEPGHRTPEADDPPEQGVDNGYEQEKLIKVTNKTSASPTVTKPSSTSSKWAFKQSLISTPMKLHPRIQDWLAAQPPPRPITSSQRTATPARLRAPQIKVPRTAGPDPRVKAAKLLGPVPAPQSEGHPQSPSIVVSNHRDETSPATNEEHHRIGTTSSTSTSADIAKRIRGDNGPTRTDPAIEPQVQSSPLSSLPSSLERVLMQSPTLRAAHRTFLVRKPTPDEVKTAATEGLEVKTDAIEAMEDEAEPVSSNPPIQTMEHDQFRSSPPQTELNHPETSSPASSILVAEHRYHPLPGQQLLQDAMKVLVADNVVPPMYVLRLQRVREAVGNRVWNEWRAAHPLQPDGTLWEYEDLDWQQLLLRFGTSYADWFKSVVITEASVVTTDPVVTTGRQTVLACSDRESVHLSQSSTTDRLTVDTPPTPVEDLSLGRYSHPLQTELPSLLSHIPGEYPHTETTTSSPPAQHSPSAWSQRFFDTLVPPIARRLFSPARSARPQDPSVSVKSEETEEVLRPDLTAQPEMQETPGWRTRLASVFDPDLREYASEPDEGLGGYSSSSSETNWAPTKPTRFRFQPPRKHSSLSDLFTTPDPSELVRHHQAASPEQHDMVQRSTASEESWKYAPASVAPSVKDEPASLFEDYDLPSFVAASDFQSGEPWDTSLPLQYLQSLPPLSSPFFTRAFSAPASTKDQPPTEEAFSHPDRATAYSTPPARYASLHERIRGSAEVFVEENIAQQPSDLQRDSLPYRELTPLGEPTEQEERERSPVSWKDIGSPELP
ncbi:hypothetical protein BJ508DRAFT_309355 [Ascobolus immersus RN42]|uniref:Uncharacterized protein n=1 Tax=Ascobolus immersus RN42 TaxID=1160509 RepID=A0A3N4I2B3_ASCIM|nr:hypothetical protein BJ508DRAFT_309355 [Ascobolus immersus RN42]